MQNETINENVGPIKKYPTLDQTNPTLDQTTEDGSNKLFTVIQNEQEVEPQETGYSEDLGRGDLMAKRVIKIANGEIKEDVFSQQK